MEYVETRIHPSKWDIHPDCDRVEKECHIPRYGHGKCT